MDLSRPEAAACPQHDGEEEKSDQSVIPPSGMMLQDACVSQEDAGWGYEPIWGHAETNSRCATSA